MAELMLHLPGNVWELVLHHLQDPCTITIAASSLLASSRGIRHSCLLEDKLWELLTHASWSKTGGAVPAVHADNVNGRSWQCYAALSENLHFARLCWAACASGPLKPASPKQSRSFSPELSAAADAALQCSPQAIGSESMVRVEVGFEVSTLRANASLIVASSRKTNEVRLFQSKGLGRLPTLRLKGQKPGVDALDLAPEHDVLAAGGVDGQITIHSISDASGSLHRLGRFCKPTTVRDMPVASPLFAGFHFLHGSGGGQLLAAARLGSSAQVLDIASDGTVFTESTPFGGASGLIACEPLGGGNSVVVLMNTKGSVRLWDVRAPGLIHAADLPVVPYDNTCGLTLGVNVGQPAAAVVSGATVHWADLRAGRLAEASLPKLWPTLFSNPKNEPGAARIVLARQGLIAAWFDGLTAPVGCWLGGGAALIPLMAGEATNAVTAVTLPFGGGAFAPPFAVAHARPSRRRRRLVYEVCAAEAPVFSYP